MLMSMQECRLFGFILKKRLGGVSVAPTLLRLVNEQVFNNMSYGYGRLVGKQSVNRHSRTKGNDGLWMLRYYNIIVLKMQPFGKHLYQFRVEGKRTPFKDDGRAEFQALRQSANGLFGDGVESGKRNVLAFGTLQQQGLDVGLGKHTATTRDVIHLRSGSRQSIEFFRFALQQGCNLVDERPCATSTTAVHTHVVGCQLAVFILAEENHFGILPT